MYRSIDVRSEYSVGFNRLWFSHSDKWNIYTHAYIRAVTQSKSLTRGICQALFNDNENFHDCLCWEFRYKPSSFPRVGWEEWECWRRPLEWTFHPMFAIQAPTDCPRPVIYLIFSGNRVVRVLFYWSAEYAARWSALSPRMRARE